VSSARPSIAQLRRWLVAVLGAVAVAGCSVAGPIPAPPSHGMTASSASSSAPSSSSSALPPDGRPVQPIPPVRPAGFADPPPGQGLPRYRNQPLSWTPCLDQLRCAKVLVPLDYAKPDQQAITLSLAARPATAGRRLGTLFVNPGGPGVSGIGLIQAFRGRGLGEYDIVGWDPRGVGQSTPVRCFEREDLDRYLSTDRSPDNGSETSALIAEERSLGQSCLQRSGALLAHVSTAETVRDLDLLRGLVGDAKINYLGLSYGTRIGALYAQLFPKRVGRLVLDGAVNITGNATVQAQGFERALEDFASWAASQHTELGGTKEEVLLTVTTMLNQLDSTPIMVGSRSLTQQLAVTAIVFPLYGQQDAWAALRNALLLAVRDHDGGRLLRLADQFDERSADGDYGQWIVAFPAIRCLDSSASSVRAAVRESETLIKKAPAIGPFWGPDLTCPLWPVAPAPPMSKIIARGAAPIVVIGTTGDPATPYEYAVGMARQLESAVLVTFHGSGHLAYGQSECVRQIVRDYLVNGVVPPDETSCST
jgi:pimeloyl-ACP methyl ester carboxylesterase